MKPHFWLHFSVLRKNTRLSNKKMTWSFTLFYTETHHSHWREGCHHVDECGDHVELPCLQRKNGMLYQGDSISQVSPALLKCTSTRNYFFCSFGSPFHYLISLQGYIVINVVDSSSSSPHLHVFELLEETMGRTPPHRKTRAFVWKC